MVVVVVDIGVVVVVIDVGGVAVVEVDDEDRRKCGGTTGMGTLRWCGSGLLRLEAELSELSRSEGLRTTVGRNTAPAPTDYTL